MRKILFFAFFLAAWTTALANLCPDGGMITGEGKGRDRVEARQKAIRDISQQIVYSITAEFVDTLSQKMTDGSPLDYNSYLETVKGKSELLAANRVEPLNDSVFYICRSYAAEPYLEFLRENFSNKLKVFREQERIDEKNCSSARGIYTQMLGWEKIIKDLKQQNPLQKEYEKTYTEIEKECAQMGKGIFLKINNEGDELSRVFRRALESKIYFKKDGKCTRGIEVLQIKAEDRGCKSASFGLGVVCTIDVSMKYRNCSNGEEFTLTGSVIGNNQHNETEAKQMMRDRLHNAAVNDFDNKWIKKLKHWEEK
jgi:hypothetical protein